LHAKRKPAADSHSERCSFVALEAEITKLVWHGHWGRARCSRGGWGVLLRVLSSSQVILIFVAEALRGVLLYHKNQNECLRDPIWLDGVE